MLCPQFKTYAVLPLLTKQIQKQKVSQQPAFVTQACRETFRQIKLSLMLIFFKLQG